MSERITISAKTPDGKREDWASRTKKTGVSRYKSSPVEHILFLQRTIGNQAVQKLIKSEALQSKLKIGKPEDKYEHEADGVVDAVMRMSEPQAVSNSTLFIQRVCPSCEEDEPRRQPIEEKELLQTKELTGHNAEITPDLESQIPAIRSGGQPLPESVRAYFEPRFGYDFSQVRAHTDAQAADTARMVNAHAFTIGRNIVFGAGQYEHGTAVGRGLLAHELTHVVQQGESILNQTAQAREENGNVKYRLNAIGERGSIPHIQMYGRNVHYDSTRVWAESIFGRGSIEAETIARNDQGLDEGWTHPTVTSIGSFLNPFISDTDVLHFPSRATAISDVRDAIGGFDINAFGRALHRFQDSFSHSFPPPPGTGYNLDSKARHTSAVERGLASTLGPLAQMMFPNTLYGRGAVIRHVILGYYPDDFLTNPEQSARDNEMMRSSIDFIRQFHHIWTTIRHLRVPVPPGLRVPSLIFGPAHMGPYIRRP